MQKSFSDLEFAAKKKLTRRERFLGEIDALVPWTELMAVIEAFYPKCGKRGRPPVGLERMLRLYVVQQCFALSDEGIEDAVYDSQSIRRFARIDLAHEDAPDSTTVLHFRHLLERHGLTERILRRSRITWRPKACFSRKAPSSMPRSFRRPPRRKTRARRAIPRCTRPRKATSGTSE